MLRETIWSRTMEILGDRPCARSPCSTLFNSLCCHVPSCAPYKHQTSLQDNSLRFQGARIIHATIAGTLHLLPWPMSVQHLAEWPWRETSALRGSQPLLRLALRKFGAVAIQPEIPICRIECQRPGSSAWSLSKNLQKWRHLANELLPIHPTHAQAASAKPFLHMTRACSPSQLVCNCLEFCLNEPNGIARDLGKRSEYALVALMMLQTLCRGTCFCSSPPLAWPYSLFLRWCPVSPRLLNILQIEPRILSETREVAA